MLSYVWPGFYPVYFATTAMIFSTVSMASVHDGRRGSELSCSPLQFAADTSACITHDTTDGLTQPAVLQDVLNLVLPGTAAKLILQSLYVALETPISFNLQERAPPIVSLPS